MKELMAKFLMETSSRCHSERREWIKNSSKLFRAWCWSSDSSRESCDYLVVRHRSRHTCDAEVRVGTVGRTCTANHEYHTARSKWTRSGSNGRSSSQRFHWRDHSAVQSSGDTRREKMHLERNTTQNTWIHVHSESTGEFPHTIERWSKSKNIT